MPEEPLIDVSPENWRIVHDILQRYVPDREVWAFGSRAKWTAKEYSDLDIAIIGEDPLNMSVMAELKDAFQESELPFKVDVVDWATIQPPFRRAIESRKVVVKSRSRNLPFTDIAPADPGAGAWLYEPAFRAEWARSTLFPLATWLNGMAFRDINFSLPGRPVIKIAEIKNGLSGQTKYTDGEYDPALLVKRGDMLFSWSGQPETSIDVFWWRGSDGWLNQHIFKVVPDATQCTAKFFFYLLKYLRPSFVGIARNKQTTGLGHVTKRDIEAIIVGLPPLSEQRAIAGILGALDDKIELNRKMSETLEAMARALFKSWFVDFDPVRAKAAGRDPGLAPEIAALFPDSFEDSELGEIPKEWRAGLLGAVAVNERRVVSHNDIPDGTPYIGLEHMPRRSIALDRWEYGAQLESNKSQFRRGEFLFGKLRPYFQKVGVAPVSGVCSTDILVVSPATAGWDAFVLMHLSSNELITHTDRCSTGTKMPRASWEHIARYEVALPPATVARSFTETVVPMVERIVAAIHESRTLAELRDALLPKLISGEIRAPEAERIVEKAL